MEPYLQLHSVDKKFTKGVKVLSFTDFKEPMEKLFSTPWTFMNDTVREHFSAKSDDWEGDYFVLCESDPHYLIDELEKLYSKEDLEPEEAELVGILICKLGEVWMDIGSPSKGYVISWSK